MNTTRVVIHGAAGRMGRRLIALGTEDPQLTVVAAIDAPGHPLLGSDAGTMAGVTAIGVPITDELPDDVEADVMIDFSLPEAQGRVMRICLDRKIPLVSATTGLTDDQNAVLHAAAEHIPVIQAANTSLAVNLTMKLAQVAAQSLKGHDADVEILERHHRFKADSPSGTALKFGQIIASEMGQTGVAHGREGQCGQRGHDEIGYHAIRTGDDPGQHTIVFGMLGETVELTVRASNRDCYALGALAAAKYLADKEPDLYGMNDVLGI